MPKASSETHREAPVAHPKTFISLEEAIEQFMRDLLGERHPQTTATARKVKAGFTRTQLTSTSREFVLTTMMELMRYTVQTLIRHGRVGSGRLTPLVRSLARANADRVLVEQYLAQIQRKKADRR
ncbi:MAG: hypothetical protein GVY35_01495 [Bacteroidetes bacterium]|jgi:hypothetical protein|nr:hypothetical protein [Bacteroidota bacterium]